MLAPLFDVRVLLGSESDSIYANFLLEVLRDTYVRYDVSVISCHRNAGEDFEKFVKKIEERIIVFIGGMSLAAPGIIESILRNTIKYDHIVFGVPTDKAARSAIEDLPLGTAIITSGLNEISIKHSIVNSALAVAKLAAMLGNNEVFSGLADWYSKTNEKKPIIPSVKLANGLIPEKNKEEKK